MDVNLVSSARSDINELMSKIRQLSDNSKIIPDKNAENQPSGFENILSMAKNAVSQVNQLQIDSDSIRNAYVAGDSNVSMSQVIIASEKSKMAFEGLLAVRNKVLEAYKEIMNMQV